MSVRNMSSNPGGWEDLEWSDMSGEEQELWSALGWSEAAWDRNSPPPSADKCWDDLSSREQTAAMGLGFTKTMWDETEDE